MAEKPTAELQQFRPTNGRVLGILGLLMCAFVAGVLIATEPPGVAVPGVVACLFVAGVVWMALLRPSVAASDTDLHLRTLFESIRIPLASVDTVVVRRYLLVRSAGQKYICPAISRPLRKSVRAEMKWAGGQQIMSPGLTPEQLSSLQTDVKDEPDLAYADFVEQRITALAAQDRVRRGIEARSEEEYELGTHVVRRTAWAELGALAALALAFVVALVVL